MDGEILLLRIFLFAFCVYITPVLCVSACPDLGGATSVRHKENAESSMVTIYVDVDDGATASDHYDSETAGSAPSPSLCLAIGFCPGFGPRMAIATSFEVESGRDPPLHRVDPTRANLFRNDSLIKRLLVTSVRLDVIEVKAFQGWGPASPYAYTACALIVAHPPFCCPQARFLFHLTRRRKKHGRGAVGQSRYSEILPTSLP